MKPWLLGVLGRVVYVALGVALALVLLLAFAGPVHGATFRGDEASCRHLAGFGERVAMLRDSGSPWQAFESHLRGMIAESRAEAASNPSYYVRDQDDEDFVVGWMKKIFDKPELTSEEAAKAIHAECMETKTSMKHGSV